MESKDATFMVAGGETSESPEPKIATNNKNQSANIQSLSLNSQEEQTNVTNNIGYSPSSTQLQTRKIFVGGLPHDLEEHEFKAYFESFGLITDIVIIHDKQTRKGRGFGFVTFESEDAVPKVLQRKFHELKNKSVEVKRAKPKESNIVVEKNNDYGTPYAYWALRNDLNTSYIPRVPQYYYAPPNQNGPLCYTNQFPGNLTPEVYVSNSTWISGGYAGGYDESIYYQPYGKSNRSGESVLPCRARSASSSSSVTQFDLYDLLGIHSSSDQSQIKNAYRSLQKRCHPDIAGAAGHDMAIILNEAYAVLSDPASRLAYDKEQAKHAELRGYTGKPIYSVWFGSESEERAVFVDEVKCVGCLKCALFAEKTFAIEAVYGRARVVSQWADPEYKIQEAMGACPVDCISIVERSNLAALEFLMSKQPRGNVRVGMGNAAGMRVSNIFTDVKKFQTRYQEAVEKSSAQSSKETDLQRAARMSAMQAIRSISNWLYWETPNAGSSTIKSHQSLIKTSHKSTEPDIAKLQDAVAARKKQERDGSRLTQRTQSKNYIYYEDYWIPLTHALPAASTQENSYLRMVTEASPAKKWKQTNDKYQTVPKSNHNHPTRLFVPFGTAMIAAILVRLHGEGAVGRLEEHIGGSLALEIVNSPWLPVILTWIIWYTIGILAVQFIQAFSRES
ncbi:Splicing factor-like protein [Parasponia andersonii]|uniref:Splicing factor-like protein n=1 Tax=Parasponia andersonii TaxID=3476 RepID=A0A2P5AEI5_PARAD|nr:Splicing factor-like protein [Parasponia andersonii]